ncbi:MAG: hypothetical protein AAF989_13360 [Planctomycetota bacterium]
MSVIARFVMGVEWMRFAVSVVCLCVFATTALADTGTLQMQFLFEGSRPKMKPIRIPLQPRLPPPVVMDESLVVDSKTKGIRDVVVFLHTGRGGTKVDPPPARRRLLQLSVNNMTLQPRVLLMRVGDRLSLANLDRVEHQLSINFFRNPPFNTNIPPGQARLVRVNEAEPAMIPVDSLTRPWMQAHVFATDHPFIAVSDEEGRIKIEGLPVGEQLHFRVIHPVLDFKDVEIAGTELSTNRRRFTLSLRPGINDLGVTKVTHDGS